MRASEDFQRAGALAGQAQRTNCQGMPLRKVHVGCDGTGDCGCGVSAAGHFFDSHMQCLLCSRAFSDHQSNPHVCPNLGEPRPLEVDEFDSRLPRGLRLAQRRTELGLSRAELAEMVQVDVSVVERMEESGIVSTVLRPFLARALRVSQSWLRT